ncbi:hypothetical protein OPT61_g4914 [Boeremia exigua]|uniref:Uncharacterized protein n=1 Tax=Boeremia exigua TaxID=749465 RepID=A0ACC2ICF7_9PLEO|nr:hypothetical protein OPT61_g4914 [Boeremia exigua]
MHAIGKLLWNGRSQCLRWFRNLSPASFEDDVGPGGIQSVWTFSHVVFQSILCASKFCIVVKEQSPKICFVSSLLLHAAVVGGDAGVANGGCEAVVMFKAVEAGGPLNIEVLL